MAERSNFYEILDLDPSVDSWDEIRKVIDKKRNRWMNSRTLGQTHKQRAEEGLKYVDEMKRVLENPETRRQEREAFLKQREADLAGKREELQKLIAKIKDRGAGCSADQFQVLVEKFAGVFTPLEIEKELDAAGMKVGAEAAPEAPAWDRKDYVEADLAKDIALNLEVCKKGDLYAFLGVDAGIAAAELFALADRRYKESVGVGRTDKEATAEQKLAGICQTLFKTEEGKASYDNYLRALPMRELHDDVDLAGASKELQQSYLDDLARRGVNLGVEEADAYAYLLWYADKRGWEIVQPSPEEEAQARAKRQHEEMMEAAETIRKAAEEARAEAERRRDQEEIERQRREAEEARRREPTPPPPPISSEPLPPPSGLRVEPRGDGFRLIWQPVSAAGKAVSYCVLRKEGSPPVDEGDGKFIGDNLTMTRLDDTEVPQGQELYYAVFSICGEEFSEDAAIGGPHRFAERSHARLAALAALLVLVIGSVYALRAMNQPISVSPLPPPGWPKAIEDVEEGTSNVKGSGQGGGVVALPPPSPPPLPAPPPPSPPPPPPRVVVPERPRVTVVATGDQRLTSAVERYLGGELSRSFEMASRRTLLLRGPSQIGNVLSTLKTKDVHVLVQAEIEYVGERELHYLGRTSIATTSRLNVDVFLVADQRGLGRGWSEQFEHTTINVDGKVESTVLAVVNDIVDEIEGGWTSYRRSLGLTP